jgi:hypothetical protein
LERPIPPVVSVKRALPGLRLALLSAATAEGDWLGQSCLRQEVAPPNCPALLSYRVWAMKEVEAAAAAAQALHQPFLVLAPATP